MGGGGHGEELVAQRLHMGAEGIQLRRVHQKIRLVGHGDLRPCSQLQAVLLQLRVDGVKVRDGVPPLAAGHVHQMHQQAAPVDVPQEIVAQTRALAGALDDAGDVRHDEADALVHVHHTQIGVQGGEVVVGDFRVGLADHTQERAFAHIGEAHQPHVRQQLQLQHHVVALAGQTCLGKPRHLPGGGGEMLVAPAAPAAPAQHIGLVVGHILDDLATLGIAHQRAPGDLDGQAFAVLAGLAAALAVHAVAGHILALVAEVHQRGHIVVHLQDDGAAAAAVAAVRTARRNIFFPVEGHRAVAAVAGPHGDPRLIDKSICHGATSLYLKTCLSLHFASILPERSKKVNKKPPAIGGRLFKYQLLRGVNRDLLAVLAQTLEADNAVRLGEQGVVGTLAHVGAGVDVGAALTHQNVASQHELPVSALGAKALGLGITAVLGGAHTFFMGKELQRNVQHFQVPSFL